MCLWTKTRLKKDLKLTLKFHIWVKSVKDVLLCQFVFPQLKDWNLAPVSRGCWGLMGTFHSFNTAWIWIFCRWGLETRRLQFPSKSDFLIYFLISLKLIFKVWPCIIFTGESEISCLFGDRCWTRCCVAHSSPPGGAIMTFTLRYLKVNPIGWTEPGCGAWIERNNNNSLYRMNTVSHHAATAAATAAAVSE